MSQPSSSTSSNASCKGFDGCGNLIVKRSFTIATGSIFFDLSLHIGHGLGRINIRGMMNPLLHSLH